MWNFRNKADEPMGGGERGKQPMRDSFLMFILFILREREREREQGWGRKRRREKIPSRLHTVSTEPEVGLDLTNRAFMT